MNQDKNEYLQMGEVLSGARLYAQIGKGGQKVPELLKIFREAVDNLNSTGFSAVSSAQTSSGLGRIFLFIVGLVGLIFGLKK